jgi:hypothetical protein
VLASTSMDNMGCNTCSLSLCDVNFQHAGFCTVTLTISACSGHRDDTKLGLLVHRHSSRAWRVVIVTWIYNVLLRGGYRHASRVGVRNTRSRRLCTDARPNRRCQFTRSPLPLSGPPCTQSQFSFAKFFP